MPSVTAANGTRFRTATQWLRLVGPEAPFPLTLTKTAPPTLAWPATTGRAYTVLTATTLGASFQPTAVVTPTNGAGSWADTNAISSARFYRVQTQH